MSDRVDGPDFLCIGAPKGGTQWLYDQLAFSPEVWLPAIKELHFFNGNFPRARVEKLRARYEANPERFNRTRASRHRAPFDERDLAFCEHGLTYPGHARDFDWYADLFAAKGRAMTGDITPAYCTLERAVVARIAGRFPELKIVFLVRDPVDRFWSAANMERRTRLKRGQDDLDLTDPGVVRAMLDDIRFRSRSYPSVTLANWRAHFPTSRIHVELFDDIATRPEEARRSIFAFLGLAEDRATESVPDDFNRKSGQEKVAIPPEIRAMLVDHFTPELERCADVLGGPAQAWGQRHREPVRPANGQTELRCAAV